MQSDLTPTLRRVRHRISTTKLHVPLTWLRHRGLTSEDVFLAAYPRSGSTWLRFLLFEILTRSSAGFETVNQSIPDVGGHLKALPLLSGEGRLIKTHEPYRKEYRRAIYLVRDARDVVISEHAYYNATGRTSSDFADYLSSFLRGEVNGYGAWNDHVHAWLRSPLAESGNLLVMRFEDMRRNIQETLARVLEFLRVEAGQQVVRDAITNNSVQGMRAKEDRSPQIPKGSRNPSSGEENRFIRSGSVGGWRERLTAAQAQLIEQYAGDALLRMGYPIGRPLAGKTEPRINVIASD